MSQVPEVATQVNIASLYVGELKSEVSEQTLWNVFGPYGQVLSVKICRDSQTQNSLGYAYINFRNAAEAENAMKHLNFTPIDGRQCRVMWSMRDPDTRKKGLGNLFIKNIDPVLDSKSLYEAFSTFGPVLSCKIAVDEYGLSKGYGFIQFYNIKDADEARLKSDGVLFMKKRLIINKFIPKSARTDSKAVNPLDFTNVFVKNFGEEWTMDDFKKRFSKFGDITSCVIQKDETGKSVGYGFVNFAKPESAAEAVKEMNGLVLQSGQKLYADKAMKKMERQMYLKKQYDLRKKEYYKKFLNLNLYVKNFDETLTDEKLKEMFIKFGKIQSYHIMKDDNGKSKGFGFVCFTTPEESQAAIAAMNSKVIDGKPLYVSLAQSREERKKIIETRTYNTSFRPPLFPPGSVPIMYPPHAAGIPYPPQFTRYPGPPPNRPQGRGMQAIGPPQHYMQQNMRPNYNYNQNGNFNQHGYRPRSSIGGHPGPRHHHNQSGSNYVQRPQVHHQHTQTSVNHVVTETTPKIRREEPKKAQIQDSRDVFEKHVYSVCQVVFTENNFDTNDLSQICGTVIDYCTNSASGRNIEDSEIKETAKNAYQSFASASKIE